MMEVMVIDKVTTDTRLASLTNKINVKANRAKMVVSLRGVEPDVHIRRKG
jgi:hypothetical protein